MVAFWILVIILSHGYKMAVIETHPHNGMEFKHHEECREFAEEMNEFRQWDGLHVICLPVLRRNP